MTEEINLNNDDMIKRVCSGHPRCFSPFHSSLYVYTYIHTYVYVHVYVNMYTYVHTHVFVYTRFIVLLDSTKEENKINEISGRERAQK